MTDYHFCGWRVRSDLPLPELPAWTGDDRAADVTVRMGAVPETLADLVSDGPFWKIARGGDCLLTVAGLASFLFARNDEVVVSLAPGADAGEARLFLLPHMAGVLGHRRGLLPLRGACVEIDGKAVVLAGAAIAGKSVLAAALARRGHRVLADEVCVVDAQAPGGPVVLPAPTGIRLWSGAMDQLGMSSDGLIAGREGKRRYRYYPPGEAVVSPVPLGAAVILDRESSQQKACFERATGPVAIMAALTGEGVLAPVAKALGREKALFLARGAVARVGPVWRFVRALSWEGLEADLDRIEGTVRP